jgi:hypothetical protein
MATLLQYAEYAVLPQKKSGTLGIIIIIIRTGC